MSFQCSSSNLPQSCSGGDHLMDTVSSTSVVMPDLVSGRPCHSGPVVAGVGAVESDSRNDESTTEIPTTENAVKETQNQMPTCNSNTASLVDNFNEVYQRHIAYFEDNYEPQEALRLKESTYQRWIGDFTEHNRLLLSTIDDLELQIEQRVGALASQLKEAHQKKDINVQMKRIHSLESDLRTMARLIRRAQSEGVWRTDGLQLIDEQFKDILQVPGDLQIQIAEAVSEKRSEEQEIVISQCEKLKKENQDLKKNILNNRVLAIEVADKHDQIMRLKVEVNKLEENLRQANMQTHFKDGVIKELRREVRSLNNTNAEDSKRSVSVCALPKKIELEQPRTEAEEKKEKISKDHNQFLNELGVILEVIIDNSTELLDSDSLQMRILDEVREWKHQYMVLEEERDIFHRDNQELEQKLEETIAENMELKRKAQSVKYNLTNKLEGQKTHLQQLKQTMVATQSGAVAGPVNKIASGVNLAGNGEEDIEDEEYLLSDTNRVLLDANQMLIDLKNEIDRKNLQISSHSRMLEGLKEEVVKKTTSLEELKKGHKDMIFEKDKLIIDLENSIRNHNNRIEDLEMEKLHLENELAELKKSNESDDRLQQVTTQRNKLEIECSNQRMTISNLKEALEGLKRDSVSLHSNNHSNAHGQSHSHNHHRSLWNWLKNMHEIYSSNADKESSMEMDVLGDLLRQFFDDNLTLDQKIDILRDENLHLKSKLFHAVCGFSDTELVSSEDEDVPIALGKMHNHSDSDNNHRHQGILSAGGGGWRSSKSRGSTGISSDRSSGIGSLPPESGIYIGGSQRFRASSNTPTNASSRRDHSSSLSPSTLLFNRICEPVNRPCSESVRMSDNVHRLQMERQCNEKFDEQREKYDQLLCELTSDLELLTDQMKSGVNTGNNADEEHPLEGTIKQLELQNDHLQVSIQETEDKFNAELKSISLEGRQLKRKVSDLEHQLRTRDTSIEELKCSESSLLSELKLQKQICKCHSEKIENQDALSIRLQEMHQLLNEKSAETVRGASALRWKCLEMERMDKLAEEEKKRLREEIEQQLKALSVAKNQVFELERSLDAKGLQVSKLEHMLEDSGQREAQLLESLQKNVTRVSTLEADSFKEKSLLRELTDDLDKVRMDGRERETALINDLTKARSKLHDAKDEILQLQDKLSLKINENESVRAENEVFARECKSLREDSIQLRGDMATMEGRCQSLTEAIKCNKFEMNALQQEINRLAGLEEVRENNKIFIKQNQDLMGRHEELERQYKLLKEQHRIVLESKDQLQISMETSKIWQKEYKSREEIINATLRKQNEHIQSLLSERKDLIVKTNELQNELIITTSTLDKYREKLGTSSNEQYQEYPSAAENNLMYEEEEENYAGENVLQPNLMRYGSDPELREIATPLQYLSKVQQLTKQVYRTGRNWKEQLQRQLLDDFYLL